MYKINIDCAFMFVLTPGERLRCSHVTDNIRPKHIASMQYSSLRKVYQFGAYVSKAD